ncbi:MAG: apolipoprotein N-acyltransferase [Limisphaerales bacterium]
MWDSGANSNRFQELIALTERALTNRTDLLIWPEAALPEFDEASYTAITNLVCTHHLWMIFNADEAVWQPDSQKSIYFNSAFLLAPDGTFAGVYRKRNLVIFGEYIPLVRWLPFVKWFTPIQGGFEAGDKPATFAIHDWNRRPPEPVIELNNGLERTSLHNMINISPLICFEDMFPQTARESVNSDTDFLVNLTNDGWFGEGAEQWQQAASGVFRAVENGVPLVRACNNGVTCWIDAHGAVRQVFKDATGGIYGVGALAFDLPMPDEKPAPTFYNRHGDWFGWACGVVMTGLLFAKIFRRKKREQI